MPTRQTDEEELLFYRRAIWIAIVAAILGLAFFTGCVSRSGFDILGNAIPASPTNVIAPHGEMDSAKTANVVSIVPSAIRSSAMPVVQRFFFVTASNGFTNSPPSNIVFLGTNLLPVMLAWDYPFSNSVQFVVHYGIFGVKTNAWLVGNVLAALCPPDSTRTNPVLFVLSWKPDFAIIHGAPDLTTPQPWPVIAYVTGTSMVTQVSSSLQFFDAEFPAGTPRSNAVLQARAK
jgi:hypothetical protein